MQITALQYKHIQASPAAGSSRQGSPCCSTDEEQFGQINFIEFEEVVGFEPTEPLQVHLISNQIS